MLGLFKKWFDRTFDRRRTFREDLAKMELHPSPADPGYTAHVRQLAEKIGLSVRDVEEELAAMRRKKEREAALEFSAPPAKADD